MNQIKSFPLDNLNKHESAIIKGISGCNSASKRLLELGLNKGSKVKMMKNDYGPIIICLSGHKLALGRCLAHCVIVEAI